MSKNDFREKIQKAMELPTELLKSFPRVTMLGNEAVFIENYKSIVEYEKMLIRTSNNICVYGDDLNVEELTADEMLISGIIKSIEYEI